ncbi:MAG TPA: GFA family protein [Rhizomicrobium sp.]|nr:GFA family protein [Rhizomicrobium sp.]
MMDGGCDCGGVRYRMTAAPMIVHCCHCRWCQRETGSGFVINAIVETSALDVTGQTVMVDTPSASGKGQKIARCPKCHVALWSHYPQAGPALAFVRAGTLDDPSAVTPDVHIFTSTKLPWVTLPQDAKIFAEFYDVPKVWPPEALARAQAAKAI